MTTRILISLLLIAFLTSFNIRTDQQEQIDKIFRTDTFYLTRTLYGGSIYVFDSVIFRRHSDSIFVKHYKHFPGPQMTNKVISQGTLTEIRNLFSMTDKLLGKKCDGPFFKLYNTTNEIVIWDRRCGHELLKDLEKLTGTN